VIKRLVANGANLPDEDTLIEARKIIQAQFPDGVPTVMDPFCGGGSTLVEAQRLGLPTFGSDLNPIPVLITRTLTQLLPKVHGQQPLHPEKAGARNSNHKGRGSQSGVGVISGLEGYETYSGYEGIIRDVTYYAELIRERAWEHLKDHYPTQPGESPIAWLWARTATCPNPACGIETILTTSWWLSKKKGDLAWIQPTVENGKVQLSVVSNQPTGEAPPPPKTGRGASFTCLGCGQIVREESVVSEGTSTGLGMRLVAVVAERGGSRAYRAPSQQDVAAATGCPAPQDFPAVPLPDNPRWFSGPRFGITHQADLYTPRQLLALTVFADLVAAVHQEILDDDGTKEWADTVSTLLGLAVGKLAQYNSSQAFLYTRNGPSAAKAAFGRNDIPMTWDFVETAIFGTSIGSSEAILTNMLRSLTFVADGEGGTAKTDARSVRISPPGLVATDPPYFDAIGYSDLSDFFYVWHRRALRSVHPDLYSTMAAPKSAELTAIPSHHGGDKEAAREYFIDGFTDTFRNLQGSMADGLPMLVVYASKEQKAGSGSGEETRWESILSAMLAADLEITGAWPIHMTTAVRMVSAGTNAVASYIVMVCRPRPTYATTVSLMEFTRALRRELPKAVLELQEASVLPVDLPQAVLGPGMRIFSRHRAVLEQSGEPIGVGRAMRLISDALGEVLDEQQGELDPDSRFAVAWWETHGWQGGPFGQADQLARPQGIAIDDVTRAGVAESRGGVVRLLGREGLDRRWKPSADRRPTAWEAVHHLADRLIEGGGVQEAARLMSDLSGFREQAQMLAYRLESIAARKGWAQDQERYNALIGSWSGLLAASADAAYTIEGVD
jgi:putative DNA methylase